MNTKLLWKDFRYFLYELWKFLGLPEPTAVQYEIAEWFQHCTLEKPQDSLTIAFRGVGKSWIRTGGTLWLAGHNPDWKFTLPSASAARATDFTRFTRMIIDQWDAVRFLRPAGNQRDTTLCFDFGPARPAQTPSVLSCGIGGQMASLRSNFIFPDDVEVPNNSFSEVKREALLTAWSEFHSLLLPGGIVHGQGTPQTAESIYNRLIQERRYAVRYWPAEIPKVEDAAIYRGNLSPSIALRFASGEHGAPSDPVRFPSDILEDKRLGAGLSHYRLHFMLDTSLSDRDRFPLKTKDLVVMPLLKDMGPTSVLAGSGKEFQINDLMNLGLSGDHFCKPMKLGDQWAPYQGITMFIDPAGLGGDEVAWVMLGGLMGNLFLLDWGGLEGGYSPENLDKLSQIARYYKATSVHVEKNWGGGMFKALLQPVLLKYHQCGLEEFTVKGQKETRVIKTLEPLINSRKLIVNLTAAQRDIREAQTEGNHRFSLFYQMTHLTSQRNALRHDDRVDILASACSHWVETVEVDNDKALKALRDRQEDEALERWLEGSLPLGCSPRAPSVPQGITNWSDPCVRLTVNLGNPSY